MLFEEVEVDETCLCTTSRLIPSFNIIDLDDNLEEFTELSESTSFSNLFLRTIQFIRESDTISSLTRVYLNQIYLILNAINEQSPKIGEKITILNLLDSVFIWLNNTVLTSPIQANFEELRFGPLEYPRAIDAFISSTTYPLGLACDKNWAVRVDDNSIIYPEENGCIKLADFQPFRSHTFGNDNQPYWCSVQHTLEERENIGDEYERGERFYNEDDETQINYFEQPEINTRWGFCIFSSSEESNIINATTLTPTLADDLLELQSAETLFIEIFFSVLSGGLLISLLLYTFVIRKIK